LEVLNEIGPALFEADIDMFRKIEVGLEFARPYRSQMSYMSTAPIGLLNIRCCNNPTSHWEAVWKSISKLKRVETIQLFPNCADRFGVSTVLSSISTMPSLVEFQLIGPVLDYCKRDFTNDFVAILDQATLKILHVQGMNEDNDWNIVGPAYEVQAHHLSESLKRNKSLQTLRLLGVSFDPTPETMSVTGRFLNALDRSNNSTLQELEICSDKFYCTIMYRSEWQRNHYGRGRHTYESFEKALQLKYLLSLNKAGRGKVQSKNGFTILELVDLLAQVGMGNENQQSERRKIVELAAEHSDTANSSAELLGCLYSMPQKTSNLWSNGVDAESVGVVYDLLQESVALWCASSQGAGHKKRKRCML